MDLVGFVLEFKIKAQVDILKQTSAHKQFRCFFFFYCTLLQSEEGELKIPSIRPVCTTTYKINSIQFITIAPSHSRSHIRYKCQLVIVIHLKQVRYRLTFWCVTTNSCKKCLFQKLGCQVNIQDKMVRVCACVSVRGIHNV